MKLVKSVFLANVNPVFAFIFIALSAVSAGFLSLGFCNQSEASAVNIEASHRAQGRVLGEAVDGFYPYPTGALVNDRGTIYFISSTSKIPFTSWQAFVGLGYAGKEVVEGDLANYSLSQKFFINTANMAHPWGSWIIYKGTVYYSHESGLIGVPSAEIFISNGGNWPRVVKANKYDIAALKDNSSLTPLILADSRVDNKATNFQIPVNLGNSGNAQNSSDLPPQGNSVLENNRVALTFGFGPSGFTLQTIKNKDNGFVIQNNAAVLWIMKVVDPQDPKKTIITLVPTKEISFAKSLNTDAAGSTLVLKWSKVPVLGTSDTVDVTGTVYLPAGSAQSQWNIQVDAGNLNSRALWSVMYPIASIAPLSNDPEGNFVYVPNYHNSLLIDKPFTKITQEIVKKNPGLAEIQLMTVFDRSRNGLFYGTQDGKGNLKDYHAGISNDSSSLLGQGIVFAVEQYPENMLTKNLSYSSPYPAVMQPYQGDWYDAAKIYRSWALTQSWVAQGTLKKRADVPKWFKENHFFAGYVSQDSEKNPNIFNFVVKLMEDYKSNLGLDSFYTSNPVVASVNNISGSNLFRNPDYFPLRSGYKEFVEQLHQSNIKLGEYIDTNDFSKDSNAWNTISGTGDAYVSKDVYGNYGTSEFPTPGMPSGGSGDPSLSAWRAIFSNVVEKFAKDYGVDGAYLDTQTSGMPPSMPAPGLDFSTNHGHPQGGGTYWTEGTLKILSEIRAAGRAVNSKFFTTSEYQTENFIGNIDAVNGMFFDFMSPNGNSNLMLLAPPPVVETVYHDYQLSEGGLVTQASTNASMLSMCAEVASQFIYGDVLVILDIDPSSAQKGSDALLYAILRDPNKSQFIPYFKRLLKVGEYAEKYLTYGELLRPLFDYQDKSNYQLVNFAGGIMTQDQVYIPKVLSSVWKADDGKLGIVLTNYNSTAQSFNLDFKFENYGLTPGISYVFSQLDESGSRPLMGITNSFQKTFSLDPYSAAVYEIAPGYYSPSLSITTSSPLPDGAVGQPYSQTLQASGGSGSYEWTVLKDSAQLGNLPPGLSFTSSANIFGTPGQAGNYNFTVSVADKARGNSVQKQFSLNVMQRTLQPLSISLALDPKTYKLNQKLQGAATITNNSAGSVNVSYKAEFFRNGLAVNPNPQALSLAVPAGTTPINPYALFFAAFNLEAIPNDPNLAGDWKVRWTILGDHPISIEDTFTVLTVADLDSSVAQ